MAFINHLNKKLKQSLYNPSHNAEHYINVNWPERIASVIGGVYLIFSGLKNIKSSPISGTTKSLAGGYLLIRGATGHCEVYQGLGQDSKQTPAINIRMSLIVHKPRFEMYNFWRNLENIPLFMSHIKKIKKLDSERSQWFANIPGGIGAISWNAKIVKEEEGSLIGWQSVEGSMIDNAGKIEFFDTANPEETELKIVISYHPPLGNIGTGIAKLLSPVFERLVAQDVKNFKQYIETGEISAMKRQALLKNSYPYYNN